MFGESDSESPRTGSPWDSLLCRSGSASPPDENQLAKVIPKLVPEVEKVRMDTPWNPFFKADPYLLGQYRIQASSTQPHS